MQIDGQRWLALECAELFVEQCYYLVGARIAA